MAQSAVSESALDLESLAADVVALAMRAGASDAESVIREGDEFSVNVRMGEVETLKESGSRGLGLRVFLGKSSASTSTSDFTADGIQQLVEGAMALAKVTEGDPFTGLPETGEFGSLPEDQHLFFDDVYSLAGPERIEWARRCEAAALAADPRITNSDGGSFDASTGRMILANSRGFLGSYRSSYAGVSAAPLAMDANGQMQRDGWWSSARRLADVESPEAIGKEAARRTLRRLGAQRVPTQRVPIVFAPEVARSLIGSVFEAASGDSIWRSASFLAGKLGEPIAAPNITIVDDNAMLLPTGAGKVTCSTPTPRASSASSPHTTPRADSPGPQASATATFTSSRARSRPKRSSRPSAPAFTSPASWVSASTWSPETTLAEPPAYGSRTASSPTRLKKLPSPETWPTCSRT